MKRYIGICVCFLLAVQPVALSAGSENNSKIITSLVHQTIGNWLDILTKKSNLNNVGIFTDDSQLSLLSATEQVDIDKIIAQRQDAFQGGVYTLNSITIISEQSNEIEAVVVLDWQKEITLSQIETARVHQLVKLTYSEDGKRLLISNIFESYGLPTDGLGVKLKC